MIHPFMAPTGRVKSFMEDPNRGTLPASCTITKFGKVFNEHGQVDYDAFKKVFNFIQVALVTAAGVNVHLDGFENISEDPFAGRLVSEYVPGRGDLILEVQDSMQYDPLEDGGVGIIETTGLIFEAINSGRNVIVDVSRIRPEGVTSSKGQISSGPDSFMQIFKAAEKLGQFPTLTNLLSLFSMMNSVIRRGGIYKNGAVTVSFPAWGQKDLMLEYLNTVPNQDHPWLSKGFVLPSDWSKFINSDELDLLLQKVNNGSIWLEKAVSAKDNKTWLTSDEILSGHPRLNHNVCREVLLEPDCTCILMPINLGQMQDPTDLPRSAAMGMEFLCQFQRADHQSKAGIYKSAKEDKQVGLGFIGLANLLNNHGLSYKGFTEALKEVTKIVGPDLVGYFDSGLKVSTPFYTEGKFNRSEFIWASAFADFFYAGAKVAHKFQMNRAFAIAPTAGVAYRYTDTWGFTTAPEISPPIGREVETLSDTNPDEEAYFDHGAVEVASEVGFSVYFELANTFQSLMDSTGMGHAISFNVWQDMDRELFLKWCSSNLKSTYYRLEIETDFLDKSDQVKVCTNSCGSCAL